MANDLLKMLKLQHRDHQAAKGNGLFLFLESRISEKQMWEPFCLPETLKYFSLRERTIVWAVCSGVSTLSALSHAETGQFSGSGDTDPPDISTA